MRLTTHTTNPLHQLPHTTQDALHAACAAVACFIQIRQSRRQPKLIDQRRASSLACDWSPTASSLTLIGIIYEPAETITFHHKD
jgi:hypothetical protein